MLFAFVRLQRPHANPHGQHADEDYEQHLIIWAHSFASANGAMNAAATCGTIALP